MNRAERESLTECLFAIYEITLQMQSACANFDARLPSVTRPDFEKDVVLRSFSIPMVEIQRLLQEAADKLAKELKNVRVPDAPALN